MKNLLTKQSNFDFQKEEFPAFFDLLARLKFEVFGFFDFHHQ